MNTIVMAGAGYELGEQVREYKEAANFATVIAEHRIPDMPELMGFGQYRQTENDILTLAIKSGQQSLERSGLQGEDIDVVLFCSTNFGVIDGDGREYVYRLCKELGLSHAYPMGITLGNCTAFLSAIKLAESMLQSETYQNILVVTADKVYDESQRCIQYGIFSDAAASCIVSRRLKNGFPVLSTDFKSDYKLIHDNNGLNDTELYQNVQHELFTGTDFAVSDIKKAFSGNIFIPITRAKETRIGFTDDQLFFANVAAKGHCFSADALINLCDYTAANDTDEELPFVLSADADGLRVSILLGQYQKAS